MKLKPSFGNFWKNIIALVAILLLAFSVNIAKDKVNKTMKSTFLIKLPHTPESCLATLDDIKNEDPSILKKIEWGCMEGDHTGYLMVEAKSKDEVLASLPPVGQKEAKIEKLNKFSVKDIENFHKSHK